MEDEEIKSLTDSLPFVIQSGRARSTVEKYETGWKNWLIWSEGKPEVCQCPADPFFVAIYLNHVLHANGTKGALISAMYGIRWAHHTAGFNSPTDDPFVKLVFDGCERICGKPIQKKDPLTTPMVKTLVDTYKNSRDLKELRFLQIVVICFTGFLRIDEILGVKLKQLAFSEGHMEIVLPRCKNDQAREGNIVYIARTGTEYCPVLFTETFLAQSGALGRDEAHLVPRLVRYKSGLKAHAHMGISYTTARECFANYIQPVAVDGLNFSTHSMRAGGASEAAASEVEERLISKHGRWKTTKARDGYIKDTLHNRLKISKSLGL